MITTTLTLAIGSLVKKKFVLWDSIDMEILDFSKASVENVNDLLRDFISEGNYAELRFHVTGVEHEGFLIGSFRRIKTKNRGYQWQLT